MAERNEMALLISDMQNDFCAPGGKVYDRGSGHAETVAACVREIAELARAARASKVRVLYVRNTHLPDGVDITTAHLQYFKKSGLAGNLADIACVAGTWGHAVVDALAPEPGDIVMDKYAFNSLHASMLDKVLCAQEVAMVYVTGVSTHSGILASTFGLRDHGYQFAVVRECVAAYERHLHEAALEIMKPYAVSAAQVRAEWTSAR